MSLIFSTFVAATDQNGIIWQDQNGLVLLVPGIFVITGITRYLLQNYSSTISTFLYMEPVTVYLDNQGRPAIGSWMKAALPDGDSNTLQVLNTCVLGVANDVLVMYNQNVTAIEDRGRIAMDNLAYSL